jgi:hypothetical protein
MFIDIIVAIAGIWSSRLVLYMSKIKLAIQEVTENEHE